MQPLINQSYHCCEHGEAEETVLSLNSQDKIANSWWKTRSGKPKYVFPYQDPTLMQSLAAGDMVEQDFIVKETL